MSGIDPTSILNRAAPQAETNLPKVSPAVQAREDGGAQQKTTQQNAAWQGQSQGGGDPAAGRRGHSDPAVSLSASFARIDLGSVLKATVIGFDAARQPIIKTDQGTFILDAQNASPPLDLKLNSQLELKITAVDHQIVAQIISQDNSRPAAPQIINLTLVGVDESGNAQGGANPALVNVAGGAAARPPVMADGLALQYAPQPGQAALLTGVSNMPPVALPPSVFISPRGAQGEGVAIGPASVEMIGLPGRNPQPPLALLTSGDQLSAPGVGPGIAAPDAEMALLPPPAPAATGNIPQKNAPAAPALVGLVWQASVAAAAGQTGGPQPVGTTTPQPASPLIQGDHILVKIAGVELTGELPGGPANGAVKTVASQLYAGQSGPLTTAAPPNMPSAGLGVIALSPTAWRMTGVVTGSENPPPTATAGSEMVKPEPVKGEAALKPGAGPEKILLLSTPLGLLRVQATVDVPVGSRLVIELGKMAGTETPAPAADPATLAKSPAVGNAALAAKPARPLFAYLDHWPAIDNILGALTAVNPGLAAALQARLTASPGNLGNAALFLVQALGLHNGAEQWLGRETANALVQGGHQALLAALKDDLNRMAEAGRDAAPSGWKPLLLPVFDGRESHALPVLIRHSSARDDKDKTSGDGGGEAASDARATRFVVDVSLSRLGPVQMDGLVKARSFNLVMRTEKPMGGNMRNEISQIFARALARNKFEGDLFFQPGNPFPVSVADYLKNGSGGQGMMAGNYAGGHLPPDPGDIYV